MRRYFEMYIGSAAAALLFLPVMTAAQYTKDQITKAPNAGLAHQQQQQKGAGEALLKQAAALPTPKLADGHVDLNGRWTPPQVFCDKSGKCQLDTRLHGYAVFVDNQGIIHADRLAPESSASGAQNEKDGAEAFENLNGFFRGDRDTNKPPYKPELMAKVEDLNVHENEVDPHMLCHPNGIPREGPPGRILQTPNMMVFLYADGENGNWWRVIPTDGRPHRTDLDPSYFGDSVGHWEGDTLVVDVNGFNDDTWLGTDGWFHSMAMHVVERFTRKGDTLKFETTVEDPQVLTQPWVKNPVSMVLNTDPESEIYEVARCENQDVGHLVNHDHL
jgi:hypothetical protein